MKKTAKQAKQNFKYFCKERNMEIIDDYHAKGKTNPEFSDDAKTASLIETVDNFEIRIETYNNAVRTEIL